MTTYSVTSGHTSTSLTLGNGDFLYVSSAGTATFTTVSFGGTEILLSGGTVTIGRQPDNVLPRMRPWPVRLTGRIPVDC